MWKRIGTIVAASVVPLVAFVLLLGVVRPAAADDIIVNPGESIQAAIDAAQPGDTILIMPGTYTESLTLNKAVSLTGVSSATVIIHAEPHYRVLDVSGPAVDSSVVISELTFTDGEVWGNAHCPSGCGGGIRLWEGARPRLQNLILRDNWAGGGGGIYAGDRVTITNSLFEGNEAYVFGGGFYAGAGATISGATFVNNTINEALVTGRHGGGGAYVEGLTTITGSHFEQNACLGTSSRCFGGAVHAMGALTLTASVLEGNFSAQDGGGLWVAAHLPVQISAVKFSSNTAGRDGGAFAHGPIYEAQGGSAAVVNSLFVGNNAGVGGDALHLSATGGARVIHNTIASTQPLAGQAVYVLTGTVEITNTIVTSHAVAIENVGGTVSEDYNLTFGNTADFSGTVTSGGHTLFDADPAFVDPAAGDYHLGPASPALDNALDLGIPFDLDGVPRPQGAGPDRGAYERPAAPADLSISLSALPAAPALPGQPVTFTLSYTNAGPETAAGVVITDLLPLTLTNPAYVFSGATITPTGTADFVWQVADLDPGVGGTITVTAQVSPGLATAGELANAAAIAGLNYDPEVANNTATATLSLTVPLIAFDAVTYGVGEGTAEAVITVTLDGANPYAPATVSYATADGTATGGTDYLPAEGTLTIPAGGQSATFTVTILDDGDDEPDETILLSLSDPAGAALGEPAAATLLIADDDEPPVGHRLYLPAVTRQPGGGAARTGRILALLAFWAPIVAPLWLTGKGDLPGRLTERAQGKKAVITPAAGRPE